ncbi:hypothetical protein Peur_019804 [Populus x canadensis]
MSEMTGHMTRKCNNDRAYQADKRLVAVFASYSKILRCRSRQTKSRVLRSLNFSKASN